MLSWPWRAEDDDPETSDKDPSFDTKDKGLAQRSLHGEELPSGLPVVRLPCFTGLNDQNDTERRSPRVRRSIARECWRAAVEFIALRSEVMLDVTWVLRKVSVELCFCTEEAVLLGGAGVVGSGLDVRFIS
jgi:hypothetical protein